MIAESPQQIVLLFHAGFRTHRQLTHQPFPFSSVDKTWMAHLNLFFLVRIYFLLGLIPATRCTSDTRRSCSCFAERNGMRGVTTKITQLFLQVCMDNLQRYKMFVRQW